jgi:hypothetical protein
MPHADDAGGKQLALEQRRERRKLRREKQRHENVGRATEMHATPATTERREARRLGSETRAYVGCSGWFYWRWPGSFYPPDLPTNECFDHYAKRFDTVEINASFYSCPQLQM